MQINILVNQNRIEKSKASHNLNQNSRVHTPQRMESFVSGDKSWN